jgi:zinc-finger
MTIATFIGPPDREEPVRAAIFPEPRSFFWLPIDGERHAARIRDREVLNGEPISTLCGQHLTRAPAGDVQWLWPTCPACWDTTAAKVGCGHESVHHRCGVMTGSSDGVVPVHPGLSRMEPRRDAEVLPWAHR